MHRGNRSAPWKEPSRVGLAPDLSVRQCQKGGSGRSSFRPLSVFSVQLRTLSLKSLALLTRSASMYRRNSAGELATGYEPSGRMRSRMSEPRQRFRHRGPDRQRRKATGRGDCEPSQLCLIAECLGGLCASKIGLGCSWRDTAGQCDALRPKPPGRAVVAQWRTVVRAGGLRIGHRAARAKPVIASGSVL